MVTSLLPQGAAILDFGAGTGIDAKAYAAAGHLVFVHEPAENARACLRDYCHEELTHDRVVETGFPAGCEVAAIVANYAVLNLIEDHRELFRKFDGVLAPGGFVLVSLLNPYFLGDVKYRWWRGNLTKLLRTGRYKVAGESGNIHRFTARCVARAAAPAFQLVRAAPWAGRRVASRYMFLLFRRA